MKFEAMLPAAPGAHAWHVRLSNKSDRSHHQGVKHFDCLCLTHCRPVNFFEQCGQVTFFTIADHLTA